MTFTNDLQQGLSPYRQKVNEVLRYLVEFLKNPILGMRHPPNWDWQVLLIFNASVAGICGLVAGIVSLRLGQMIAGLIISPISNTIIVLFVSGFFYYTFLFIFKREVAPKKLLALIILANLPRLALYPVEIYLPQVSIISLAASCLLLYVGFAENTGVESRHIQRLLGGIFAVFLVLWIYGTISVSREKKSIKDMTTPGTLDILEQDMKGSD